MRWWKVLYVLHGQKLWIISQEKKILQLSLLISVRTSMVIALPVKFQVQRRTDLNKVLIMLKIEKFYIPLL